MLREALGPGRRKLAALVTNREAAPARSPVGFHKALPTQEHVTI